MLDTRNAELCCLFSECLDCLRSLRVDWLRSFADHLTRCGIIPIFLCHKEGSRAEAITIGLEVLLEENWKSDWREGLLLLPSRAECWGIDLAVGASGFYQPVLSLLYTHRLKFGSHIMKVELVENVLKLIPSYILNDVLCLRFIWFLEATCSEKVKISVSEMLSGVDVGLAYTHHEALLQWISKDAAPLHLIHAVLNEWLTREQNAPRIPQKFWNDKILNYLLELLEHSCVDKALEEVCYMIQSTNNMNSLHAHVPAVIFNEKLTSKKSLCVFLEFCRECPSPVDPHISVRTGRALCTYLLSTHHPQVIASSLSYLCVLMKHNQNLAQLICHNQSAVMNIKGFLQNSNVFVQIASTHFLAQLLSNINSFPDEFKSVCTVDVCVVVQNLDSHNYELHIATLTLLVHLISTRLISPLSASYHSLYLCLISHSFRCKLELVWDCITKLLIHVEQELCLSLILSPWTGLALSFSSCQNSSTVSRWYFAATNEASNVGSITKQLKQQISRNENCHSDGSAIANSTS